MMTTLNKIFKDLFLNRKKGVTEIIGEIFVILIIIGVVATITSILIPMISQHQSKLKFEYAQTTIAEIDSTIIKLLNEPVGSTKELNINLQKLNFEIDSANNKIQLFQLIKGNFYKDGYTNQIDSRISTSRSNQYLYTKVEYDNIDIINKHYLENKNQITLFFTKVDKGSIEIDVELSSDQSWLNTSVNRVFNLSNTKGSWKYRKQIIIDQNKIDSTLSNFPVMIKITDENIIKNTNADGSDIVFTDSSGTTILNSEIDYFDKTYYDYYIEEFDSQYRQVWIKTDIGANETKKIKIKKVDGFSPNPENLFYFYDDFSNNELDTTKWNYTYGSVIQENNILTLGTQSSLIVSNNQINFKDKTIHISYNSYPYKEDAKRTVVIMGENYDKGYSANTGVTLGNNINTDDTFQIYGCADCPGCQNYTSDPILAYNKFMKYEININNNLSVNQKVYQDNFNVLNESPLITVNSTYTREEGYLGLEVSSASAMDVEYIFTTKYLRELNLIKNVEEKEDYYLVTIVNRSNQDLEDQHISIPNDVLGLESKTESLEITDFDTDSKEIIAWVNVPMLYSNKDTVVYLYFGNEGYRKDNDTDIWNKDYVFVNHINTNEDTNELVGSTKYKNNLITNNIDSNSINITGKIGKAVLFDGINDYLNSNTTKNTYKKDFDSSNDYTISAWVNQNTTNEKSSAIVSNETIKESGYNLIVNKDNKVTFISGGNVIEDAILILDAKNRNSYEPDSDTNRWYDLSGYERNAITNEFVTWNELGWWEFNAIDDQRFLGNSGNGDFSFENGVSIDFFIDKAYSTTIEGIFERLNNTTNSNRFFFSNNRYGFQPKDWDEGTYYSDYGTTQLYEGSWAQVVATYYDDSGSGKIDYYKNTDLIKSHTEIDSQTYSYDSVKIPYNLGSMQGNAYKLDGNLSVFRHYNNVLTDDEIKQNYFAYAYRFVDNNATTTTTINNEEYNYIVVKKENDDCFTYVNGSLENTYDCSISQNLDGNLSIGTRASGVDEYFNGIIDEVRISNISKSQNWIQTEYNNQNSPDTFYSFGKLEER